MACGDVLSLEDLQTAKKHQIFEAEVITGKAGGVAGGASIDYADNQVTGQTQKTLPAVLRDIGYTPASFTFTTGGTLGVNDRDKAVFDPISKAWYTWVGELPKVVPAGSNPVGDANWKPWTDPTLRDDLANGVGSGLIGAAFYAQIRTYSGSGARITCGGRASLVDGASGFFQVDSSDSTTLDDDGYCLVDALGRRWKRVGFSAIDPAWYGAVSDYDSVTKSGTSSSAAFFKAVSLAAAGVKPEWQTGQTYKEVCRTVRPRTGNYKFTTSVPIPSGVIVDLNNSTIGGDGFTNTDCEAFVTGYIDADGVLKSNLALAENVGRVMSAQLINWRATNLKKFFNAKNWNESCICSDGYAYNVQQTVKAKWSFYGSVKRIISRGSAGSTALPAFEFDAFVNVMDLDSLFATDRGTTTKISGGVNGLHVRNQSYESGQDGLTITGECMPMLISSNYFEGLAGGALNLGDSSTKKSVVVDNNWFYQIGQVGIIGNNMQGGKIGSGNYFADNVAVNVNINDVVSTITVEIPPLRYSDTTAVQRPSFPSNKYILGDAVDVKYRVHIFDSASGATKAAQNYAGDRPMDMPYSGRQGFVPNKIAFCDVSRNGGGASPFTINVDSKIFFDNYVMYTFRIRVVDTNFDRMVSGRGYGSTVIVDHNTGPAIAVTAQNVNGYLRLVLSDFNGASFVCEGVLRHT